MASGTFLMQGAQGALDKKGVATFTKVWYAPTLLDVFTVGDGSPSGLIDGGRTWKEEEAGGYAVTISYEGLPDGVDGEDAKRTEDVFELDAEFGEEPIASNPEWPAIAKFYKGSVGKKGEENAGQALFEEFLDSAVEQASAFGSKAERPKNPMFGVKTYLALRAIFRWTFIVDTIPADILSVAGSIRKSLPEESGFQTPDDHDWLVMPPKATKRGNVYEIRYEMKLSQKGGWPEKVYKLIEQ